MPERLRRFRNRGRIGLVGRRAVVSAAWLLLSSPALDASVGEFRLLADNNTIAPGRNTTLFLDGQVPQACGLGIVFQDGILGEGRLYRHDGNEIELIVEPGAPVTGRPQPIAGSRNPDCEGQLIAIDERGSGPGTGAGSLLWHRNEIVDILSAQSELPDGRIVTSSPAPELGFGKIALRINFFDPSVPGSGEALLIHDGILKLAVEEEAVVGAEAVTFGGFALHLPTSQGTVFKAALIDGGGGFYEWRDGGAIQALAEIGASVPGAAGAAFGGLGGLATSELGVFYDGRWTGGEAIFLKSSAASLPLIEVGDLTTDGETLADIEAPLQASGPWLLFRGRVAESASRAIFLWSQSGIEKVLQDGDALGDRTVNIVDVRYSVGPGQLVLWMGGVGGGAIYAASLSMPASVPNSRFGSLLLAAAIGLLAPALLWFRPSGSVGS